MPLKFEPSPYRVSKYPLANLTVLVPISLALSVFGTIFPETVVIPVILTWPVAFNWLLTVNPVNVPTEVILGWAAVRTVPVRLPVRLPENVVADKVPSTEAPVAVVSNLGLLWLA